MFYLEKQKERTHTHTKKTALNICAESSMRKINSCLPHSLVRPLRARHTLSLRPKQAWQPVTCTLEKGSMTRMRFCSSRLSYSLARCVLIMGSSRSSALYSVRACAKGRGAGVEVTCSLEKAQNFTWDTTKRTQDFRYLFKVC